MVFKLALLLRAVGLIMMLAFIAAFMPYSWMTAAHRALGLGEMPATPIVSYLARSLSALYGLAGVTFLVLARDPVRFLPLLRLAAWAFVLGGMFFLAMDWKVGLPWHWTAPEGPIVSSIGLLIAYLARRVGEAR